MTKQAITIDLAAGDLNSTVKASNLIQKRAYERLHAQIQADLLSARNLRLSNNGEPRGHTVLNEAYPPGSGLVYFVDGTRGAGKSTFLSTAFAEIPSYRENDEARRVRLMQLAYIDPSRIEQNELILLSVLNHRKRVAGTVSTV
ncbi:hypothetical protein [Burkholderia thailandensis]|uniref:hypothetical protein n=2 Tax=Burkholderia thailandensis TaxID=57975 RepID=UPI000FD6A3EA|nr:hypothetical protein [Burkholderia thailandensis]NBC94626.1 hypothetical protein [Burkholderia thailandensis]